MAGPIVVLVGPPGAGKTTVGVRVATRLGVEFSDTDDEIAVSAGMSISEIFVQRGEAEFRAIERDVVRTALADHNGVLALGGGAILDEGTRALLGKHRVVFLDVDVADAASRVGLNRSRPLLFGNIRTQLRRLMDERRPHYVAVADVVIDTTGRSPNEVADLVSEATEAA